VEPEWPFALLANIDVRGYVILDVWIDAEGHVACVKVVRSIPVPGAAAVAAVQQWRFTPARIGSMPVTVVQAVAVPIPRTNSRHLLDGL
jgi:TonB family protein